MHPVAQRHLDRARAGDVRIFAKERKARLRDYHVVARIDERNERQLHQFVAAVAENDRIR